ncbi:hypothetical protein HOLleu_01308 [Holothuria leucospilota]|uniref:Uncharacterized protein n=1 Tax=Holothuria leucospilota TaxID=206669 RepID=A0A9Q1CP57_HOLLE|nr:hypothetical protein HOLleu_01308 [Holothuria leucospilota]
MSCWHRYLHYSQNGVPKRYEVLLEGSIQEPIAEHYQERGLVVQEKDFMDMPKEEEEIMLAALEKVERLERARKQQAAFREKCGHIVGLWNERCAYWKNAGMSGRSTASLLHCEEKDFMDMSKEEEEIMLAALEKVERLERARKQQAAFREKWAARQQTEHSEEVGVAGEPAAANQSSPDDEGVTRKRGKPGNESDVSSEGGEEQQNAARESEPN